MTPNITDEQRKQIISWAQANAGTEKETFNEERYCGLIDGATHYCHQKDEQIKRLRQGLENVRRCCSSCGDDPVFRDSVIKDIDSIAEETLEINKL